jgi:uncharacterized membrane protein
MRVRPVLSTLVLGLVALPLAACQTDTGTGFASGIAGGAVVGALVGGPVGAAVGGVAGAAVGGALSAEERTRVRTYVGTRRSPSIRLAETVAVGSPSRLRPGFLLSRRAWDCETPIATPS